MYYSDRVKSVARKLLASLVLAVEDEENIDPYEDLDEEEKVKEFDEDKPISDTSGVKDVLEFMLTGSNDNFPTFRDMIMKKALPAKSAWIETLSETDKDYEKGLKYYEEMFDYVQSPKKNIVKKYTDRLMNVVYRRYNDLKGRLLPEELASMLAIDVIKRMNNAGAFEKAPEKMSLDALINYAYRTAQTISGKELKKLSEQLPTVSLSDSPGGNPKGDVDTAFESVIEDKKQETPLEMIEKGEIEFEDLALEESFEDYLEGASTELKDKEKKIFNAMQEIFSKKIENLDEESLTRMLKKKGALLGIRAIAEEIQSNPKLVKMIGEVEVNPRGGEKFNSTVDKLDEKQLQMIIQPIFDRFKKHVAKWILETSSDLKTRGKAEELYETYKNAHIRLAKILYALTFEEKNEVTAEFEKTEENVDKLTEKVQNLKKEIDSF